MVAATSRRNSGGPSSCTGAVLSRTEKTTTMLCCGRKKDGHQEQTTEMAASPRRQGTEVPGGTGAPFAPGQPLPSGSSMVGPYSSPGTGLRLQHPSMVVQSDFRKVSGISTEIFRQIETVEKDHDATTAAALEAVERRGEMLVRVLDPRQMGRVASEAARTFLTMQDPKHAVHFVEIVKRPGQTLGLYIREGNGIDRSDGVFISRIAIESAVYNSGCLRVGDEILAVNLVDVTRMSLDDVVIVMSIPRRLVLTTRQRRGPAGAISPPPPRPEQKPPPVVVLKRGLQEEPLDDSTSNSNSNGGDRNFGQIGAGSSRYITSGKPLPGMADLPIHGTFPRDRDRSERDRFREREAGRYPERAPEEPHYAPQVNRPTHYDKEQLYYNFRQAQEMQRFQSSGNGTLDRKNPSFGMEEAVGSRDHDYNQVDSYQPPPPPKVITEQPKPGGPVQHYHPFERTYPKTLESLAERVHPFSALQGPGSLALSGLPGSGTQSHGSGPGSGHSATLGRASTLGRIRGGGNQPTGPGNTMSLMRAGRGLQRSGSDQRLPMMESGTDFYEYMSSLSASKSNLKSATPAINFAGHSTGRTNMALTSDSGPKVAATRRRTSIDYASDTEASTRGYGRQRTGMPGYAVERSWKTPALIGLGTTPTTPTPPATGFTAQQASSRSNSLPRDRGGKYRRGVRFEHEGNSTRPSQGVDSQDDSDGAVSAPELPSSQKHQQALAQKLTSDQPASSFHGLAGRIPASPSVFTAAEYKAWMQRAPSTSAIYERLRQSREALEAQRAAKFTFSAENLMDKTRQESPYYAYRSHFNAPTTTATGTKTEDPSTVAGMINNLTARITNANRPGEEPRGIPQPTPARSTDPRFKLLEINPAEYMKYRSERLEGGSSSATHQMITGSGHGMTTPSGPGPAPGGMEEGVSGLLWVHLLAGRCLRSTSSRLEPVRDLYCVLECDRAHKARTVIRTGDVNFDWDETFDLDLVVNRELDFLIYSWDPQLRHRLCFKGSLHLVPLLRESPLHQIALKVEPRGTIYLKLRYTEPRTAFRRLPASRKTPPPLFGVDLETILTREGSGLGVPILVQKCVEEVERRGMDIVGLYRLCGSATKKRILREAFERNPRLVDLSPDSVPDINVITGLLKEYLRELPEPLLTKCLYQMLVDALAVCLPDDPEGNAKLMFSILECLPKGNRTTLFLLMDHLCLVAAQSDRNKMTPQNLAICFGPVLMLHSDDVSSLDFQKPIGVLKYLLQIWPMKSARAAEAAATANLTLRRSAQRLQPQQATGLLASAQQPTTSASASAGSSPLTSSSKVLTSAPLANPLTTTCQAGPADRSLDLPPVPPRPAPRVLQSRVNGSNESGVVKSQRALVAFGGSVANSDVIAARGEADGSPAPLSDFLTTADSGAGPGSEDATPASSVTPSLTSPTSTSTTSASPQPPLRGVAEGRRNKDYSDSLSSHPSQPQAGLDTEQETRTNMKGATPPGTRADDTDQGESDLESPN